MNISFGTDGIRSRIGTSLFTFEHLPHFGAALAQWACTKYGPSPRILIAHDTRESCSFIAAALKTGLLLHPVTLFNAQVLSTPAAYYVTQKELFDCAIVISASHNPYYDNGIKIFDRITGKLTHEDENSLTTVFAQPYTPHYTTFGHDIYYPQAHTIYKNYVTSLFPPLFLTGKKIVIDCAQGATAYLAPDIFTAYGATVITLGTNPTGTNINAGCGATDIKLLQKTVTQEKADCGFAFDGDGDRIIAVNSAGECKDGDDILALLMHHPAYAQQKTIVCTIMSNQGLEEYARQKSINLMRTAVGDKHIMLELTRQQLWLGGEQSGHIILRDILPTGDGILAALRCAETMNYIATWNFATFTKFPQVIINIPTTKRCNLTEEPFATHITQAEKKLGNGRILVRYSGTEPLLRVMIEAATPEKAENIGSFLVAQLQKELI